jgi:hypothetical protein
MTAQKTLAVQQISLPDLQTMAKSIADSKMFGVTNEAQALSLMLLCQAEGLHPVLALRRYHIIENKPSMRADALQGDFEKIGSILWHARTDEECSATFFVDKKKCDAASIKRAKSRYKALKENKPTDDLAEPGELTIIRTFKDAVDKKVACTWKTGSDGGKYVLKHNWRQSPRQMLHARCLSEGVRAIAPGIIAGVYTEDEIYDMVEPETATAPAATAEELVKGATANRVEASGGEPVIEGEIVVEGQPEQVVPETDVTQDNFKDVECHIGKAEGQMLGKKVGELQFPLVKWLSDHYGDGEGTRWGNPPTPKDERLKTAIDFAVKAREERKFNGPNHEALYNKFEDEWSREDFVEAMRAETGSFPQDVKTFYDLPEGYATKCVENFEGVKKIIDLYTSKKKKK